MSGKAQITALVVGVAIGLLAGLGGFFAFVGAVAFMLLVPVHGLRVLLTGVPAYLATAGYLARTDPVPDWGRGIQSMDTLGYHSFPPSGWHLVAACMLIGTAGWAVSRASERKRRSDAGPATTR